MSNGFGAALKEVRRELAQKNTMELARFSGAALSLYPPLSWREFTIPFLSRIYQVSWPSGEVLLYNNRKQTTEGVSLILLHYLVNSTGKPPSGNWLRFSHLPGGNRYYPAFKKRALDPLVGYFGKREKLFSQLILQRLHGRPGKEPGSYQVMALPRLPLYLRIIPEEGKIPARSNILFDDTANEYLPTADLALVGEVLAVRLLQWGRARTAR
ncbi:MAG: DUF3786 domain-containing protein [Firmicutes bacterium]|nr:DUF3786 domain-containing protein [Bacillota bacterium]